MVWILVGFSVYIGGEAYLPPGADRCLLSPLLCWRPYSCSGPHPRGIPRWWSVCSCLQCYWSGSPETPTTPCINYISTDIKYIVFNRWQPISINTFVRFDVVPDNRGFPRPPWTRWCVVGGPHWWHTPGSPWTRPYRTGPAVASQIWASCSHCKQQNNLSLSFKRSYLEYFCNAGTTCIIC